MTYPICLILVIASYPCHAHRNRAHAPALPATPYVSLHPAQKRAPSAAHTAGTAGRAQAAPAANASAGAARTAGTAGKAQAAVPANTPAPRSSPVMLLQALPLNQRPQVRLQHTLQSFMGFPVHWGDLAYILGTGCYFWNEKAQLVAS